MVKNRGDHLVIFASRYIFRFLLILWSYANEKLSLGITQSGFGYRAARANLASMELHKHIEQ